MKVMYEVLRECIRDWIKNPREFFDLRTFKNEWNKTFSFLGESEKRIIRRLSITTVILIITCSSMFFFSGSAMMAPAPATIVHDPSANAHLAANASSTAATAEAARKQLSTMQKTMKALNDVNSAITSVSHFSNVIENQKYIIKNIKTRYDRLKDSEMFTAHELSIMLYNFERILKNTTNQVNLYEKIISDKILKMNDADRISALQKVNENVSKQRTRFNLLTSRYYSISRKRQLIQLFSSPTNQ